MGEYWESGERGFEAVDGGEAERGTAEGSSARDGAREIEGAEPWDGGRLRDGVKERGRGDLDKEEERFVMIGVLSLPLNWT